MNCFVMFFLCKSICIKPSAITCKCVCECVLMYFSTYSHLSQLKMNHLPLFEVLCGKCNFTQTTITSFHFSQSKTVSLSLSLYIPARLLHPVPHTPNTGSSWSHISLRPSASVCICKHANRWTVTSVCESLGLMQDVQNTAITPLQLSLY